MRFAVVVNALPAHAFGRLQVKSGDAAQVVPAEPCYGILCTGTNNNLKPSRCSKLFRFQQVDASWHLRVVVTDGQATGRC